MEEIYKLDDAGVDWAWYLQLQDFTPKLTSREYVRCRGVERGSNDNKIITRRFALRKTDGRNTWVRERVGLKSHGEGRPSDTIIK